MACRRPPHSRDRRLRACRRAAAHFRRSRVLPPELPLGRDGCLPSLRHLPGEALGLEVPRLDGRPLDVHLHRSRRSAMAHHSDRQRDAERLVRLCCLLRLHDGSLPLRAPRTLDFGKDAPLPSCALQNEGWKSDSGSALLRQQRQSRPAACDCGRLFHGASASSFISAVPLPQRASLRPQGASRRRRARGRR